MTRSTFTFRQSPEEISARTVAAAKHGLRPSRRRKSGLSDLDLILMGKGPFQQLRRIGRSAGAR